MMISRYLKGAGPVIIALVASLYYPEYGSKVLSVYLCMCLVGITCLHIGTLYQRRRAQNARLALSQLQEEMRQYQAAAAQEITRSVEETRRRYQVEAEESRELVRLLEEVKRAMPTDQLEIIDRNNANNRLAEKLTRIGATTEGELNSLGFICPISKSAMQHPVRVLRACDIDREGSLALARTNVGIHRFDLRCFRAWQTRSGADPLSREILNSRVGIKNPNRSGLRFRPGDVIRDLDFSRIICAYLALQDMHTRNYLMYHTLQILMTSSRVLHPEYRLFRNSIAKAEYDKWEQEYNRLWPNAQEEGFGPGALVLRR